MDLNRVSLTKSMHCQSFANGTSFPEVDNGKYLDVGKILDKANTITILPALPTCPKHKANHG